MNSEGNGADVEKALNKENQTEKLEPAHYFEVEAKEWYYKDPKGLTCKRMIKRRKESEGYLALKLNNSRQKICSNKFVKSCYIISIAGDVSWWTPAETNESGMASMVKAYKQRYWELRWHKWSNLGLTNLLELKITKCVLQQRKSYAVVGALFQ